MIGAREDPPGKLEDSLNRSGDARPNGLHSPSQGLLVFRFHDEMEVIVLDAVVHEPEVRLRAGLREALAQLGQQNPTSKIRESLPNAKRHMDGLPTRKGFPFSLGIAVASGGFSPGSLSRTPSTAVTPVVVEAELGGVSHKGNIPQISVTSTVVECI